MRPLAVPTLALLAAVAIAACSAVDPPTVPGSSASAGSSTGASASAPSARAVTPPPSASSPAPETSSPGAASPGASGASGSHHGSSSPVGVTMVDFAFEPAAVEVGAGQTVRWTNEGSQPHSVKTDDGSISSPLVVGEPFEWTAEGAAGTEIAYFCGVHPSMTGSITITE